MPTTAPLPEMTGLILAGGRGSRMQQLDKGLQTLNGQKLIEHVIARLRPQVQQLAINANRHLDDYARCGYPVWSDIGFNSESNTESDFQGPLAGVETGLLHCSTPYLLTVPCDSPFLPHDLADRLMTALIRQRADVAVACTGSADHLLPQPVFCLMPVSALAPLQNYFHSGGRKMNGWYSNSSVAKVYFADESEFRNINTLEELRECAIPKSATRTAR
jgi:molybdopterin-guanine dinucleotide biosynthesis protein A